MKNKGIAWELLLFVIVIIGLFIMVGFFSSYIIRSLKLMVTLVAIGFMILIGYRFYKTDFKLKRTEDKIAGFFLLFLLVFTFTWLQFGGIAEKLIYRSYVYVEGKAQNSFDRCNPCDFNIIVDEETREFQDVRFGVKIEGINTWVSSNLGRCPGGAASYCENYCSPNRFNPDSWQCYKTETKTLDQVTITHGRTTIFDWSPDNPTTQTDNIAKILESCPKGDECSFTFTIRGSNNFGSFKITTAPEILTYKPITTTTTRRTTTTRTTTTMWTTPTTTQTGQTTTTVLIQPKPKPNYLIPVGIVTFFIVLAGIITKFMRLW